MAVVTGTPGGDFLDGTSASDEISGLAGDDGLYGYAGDDLLEGGSGNDWLDGGGGVDTMVGGVGDEVYIVDRLADVVVEQAGEGADRIETKVSLTLPQHIEGGNFIGAGDGSVAGNALDNFIYGNDSDNTLVGGAGSDALYALGGSDSLEGGAGNDWLDGGAGVDTMVGGNGDEVYIVSHLADVVVEQADGGSDRIETKVSLTLPGNIEGGNFIGAGDGSVVGNALDNFIYGNDSDNTLVGGAGVDFLYGHGGNDSLVGGTGDDGLDGGAGTDTMAGGGGDDVYIVSHLADVVVEQADRGSDRIETKVSLTLPDHIEDGFFIGVGDGSVVGNALDNFIYGNDSDNTLVGGAGADFLYALGGNDSLDGGTGDDWLDGGPGIDTMVGGTGDEVYIVTHLADVVVERAGEGSSDRIETKVSLTLPDHIEDGVFIGAGDGSVVGNALDNFIYGNDSDNTLVGGAGVDFLYDHGGNDSLVGGTGDDRLEGGGGVDTMVGGGGDDIYVVNTVSDLVVEAPGKGADSVETSVSLTLPDNIEGGYYTGPRGGGIVGNEFDNLITGNVADNALDGAGGLDTVSYAYEANAVTVDLASGVAAGSGADTVTDFENAEGGRAADTLIGTSGANVLDGRAGVDTMSGGYGDDIYHVDNAADAVIEIPNAAPAVGVLPAAITGLIDTVKALIDYNLSGVDFVENLTLSGSATSGTGNELANKVTGNGRDNHLSGLAGNDTVNGGSGRDSLLGGNGNDVLAGGTGKDTLNGGAGRDNYDFNSALNAATNVDRITGYSLADDLVRLDNDMFTGLATGVLAGGRFHKAAGATAGIDGNDRIVYNSTSGNLYFDSDGVGGAASVLFATLAGVPNIGAADFLVVN